MIDPIDDVHVTDPNPDGLPYRDEWANGRASSFRRVSRDVPAMTGDGTATVESDGRKSEFRRLHGLHGMINHDPGCDCGMEPGWSLGGSAEGIEAPV